MIEKSTYKGISVIVTFILLLFFIGLSIILGYTDTSIQTSYKAFTQFNESEEHIIIQTIRLPRALIAASVGASLAIAGVLMQTLTRNPLASPSILGINAGAGFAVVIAVTFMQITNLQSFTWISLLGAAVAAVGVYVIGSAGREGLTPMKLTLAGAAMTALFASFTQGLLVTNEAAFEQVLFWLSGSVQGRKLEVLLSVLPYLLVGWTVTLLISSKMNVLAMGDDLAKGLGLKVGLIKIVVGVLVILLAGSSVAIAGPIGFIGIVIPHIARRIIGTDHRWLLPFSGLLGGILLLGADIGARYIIMPQEVPVGVMTAFIGTPFFIYIARKGGGNQS
ncbi:iron ABC transporter permease [Halobacillus shinanisalinarum]|uniref:Iron ABC transporter permease n=1 Tax=Halobacillus shinanisalinarum TaxID=2932258 RepID=A0ABY4H1U5_9BACI|nr:iron ABC transporter permease [Halobacillus shinanisalinarum]UOQ94373.1 iron ABC transporter permease [Halobacillus shinanisalinarum]